MKATAKARHVRMSPRKARQVIDLVRGKNVEEAINILHFSKKKAAKPIEKTVRSAVANILHKDDDNTIDTDRLFIAEARVDGGPIMRRFRPASMGRAMRIRKRTCHIIVTVSDGAENE